MRSPFCGGCHRLFAFARILSSEKWQNAPELQRSIPKLRAILEQEWLATRLQQSANGDWPLTKVLQEQVAKVGLAPDPSRARDLRLMSGGHTLEWAATVFPAESLQEDWVLRGVANTVRDLNAIVGKTPEPVKDDIRLPGREERYGCATHAISGLSRWTAKVAPKLVITGHARTTPLISSKPRMDPVARSLP
jgi:hypothetical protein